MHSMTETKSIAFAKYFGEAVSQGLLDSRKAADALLGFDKAIRFYMEKEEPRLKEIEYEFPVSIEKGSWMIAITENIDQLIMMAGTGVVLTEYFRSLAKKSAEEGFLETGPVKDLKKIIANAIRAMQWTINIAKKTGKVGVPVPAITKVLDDDNFEIGGSGEPLIVPMQYYRLYEETPRHLFSQTARVIHADCEFEVGLYLGTQKVVASVGVNDKHIFDVLADNEDIVVLPELEHNQYVELEGEITRCTATANTIGFLYKGHILTCKPASGSISSYKRYIIAPARDRLFRSVIIKGTVIRRAADGEYKEKKPHIVFSEIVPLATTHQTLLFPPTDDDADSDYPSQLS